MKYFFILGNHPALSSAEIHSTLKPDSSAKLLANNVLTLENPATDSIKLIKSLGGTIKIGQIFFEINRHNNKEIKEKILEILDKDLLGREETGKYCFGISYYGKNNFPAFPIGLEIKKTLKENGANCRLVTSKEKVLSSVVVEQNKLTSKGAEIILIEEANSLFIGKTEAVQPFKELSFRDFGRPWRDDKSGMLPPKLAQIMLNLSGKTEKGAITLDPFCGSGTIITEAMLLGRKNLIGADISDRAVEDTRKNIGWIEEKFNLPKTDCQLFNQSVLDISKVIKEKSIDAIVTEPYLGPQRGDHNTAKTIAELERLYSSALKEFKKILKPDGKVVMVWPVFVGRSERELYFMQPEINGFEIVKPLPNYLSEQLKVKSRFLKNNQEVPSLIYGREGQKVWREIVVLKLKKS